MDQIKGFMDRPRLYYNIDGLGELGGGVTCLGFALLLWLVVRLPAGSSWHQISWFVIIGLGLVVRYATNAIKARVTYPRTGFVEYRRRDQRRMSIIAAVLGILLLGFVVAIRRHWDITTAASVAWLVIPGPAYAYRFARTVRWKWGVAGAIALGSLVIALLPADVSGVLANEALSRPIPARLVGTILLSLMIYGPLLLTSGGISFWLYLRHTHTPVEASE